jgi:hypothetical protein
VLLVGAASCSQVLFRNSRTGAELNLPSLTVPAHVASSPTGCSGGNAGLDGSTGSTGLGSSTEFGGGTGLAEGAPPVCVGKEAPASSSWLIQSGCGDVTLFMWNICW